MIWRVWRGATSGARRWGEARYLVFGIWYLGFGGRRGARSGGGGIRYLVLGVWVLRIGIRCLGREFFGTDYMDYTDWGG